MKLDEAALEAALAAGDIAWNSHPVPKPGALRAAMKAAITAYLSLAPGREPVAYRYRSIYDGKWEYAPHKVWNADYMADLRSRHPEALPLYSAPALASEERGE